MGKKQREGDVSPQNALPPIAQGARGARVALLQRGLQRMRSGRYPELLPLTVDGYFGPATETALQQYQSLAGLRPTGVADADCRAALARDLRLLLRNGAQAARDPVAEDWPGGTLHPGCRGPAVVLLQQRLRLLSDRDPTLCRAAWGGRYGQRTEQAVRCLQRRLGLRQDGAVDRCCWRQISRLVVEAGIQKV